MSREPFFCAVMLAATFATARAQSANGVAPAASPAPPAVRATLDAATLRYGKRLERGGVSYRVVRDPRFDVAGIELTPIAHDRARVHANATLRAAFDADRAAALACSADASADGRAPYRYRIGVSIAYLSPRALTLERRGIAESCGGAHPFDVNEPLTIDLVKGTAVDWGTAVVDPDVLRAAYLSRAPLAARKAKLPALCSARETLELVQGFDYGLRSGGLALMPQFAHVIAVCELEVVVPSAIARPALAPAVRTLLP